MSPKASVELLARVEIGQDSEDLYGYFIVQYASEELYGHGIIRNASSEDLYGHVIIRNIGFAEMIYVSLYVRPFELRTGEMTIGGRQRRMKIK